MIKNTIWQCTRGQKDRQIETKTGVDVYSSKEMRHLVQNQYLPWILSVMKILYACSVTTARMRVCMCMLVLRGVIQKSQFALSAMKGGVNKGIACLFFSGGREGRSISASCLFALWRVRWMQMKRTTCLFNYTAEGRHGKSRRSLLRPCNYLDVFVLRGAMTVCVLEEARDGLFICLEVAEEEAGRHW